MMKNEKGVTLTVLSITIIIMIIISGTVIYTWKDSLSIKRVNNLYSDIESISSKVTTFYLENETLPVYDTKYAESISAFKTIIDQNGAEDGVINPNDGEDYYVIDLSKLDNLTLNYGQEYNTWKEQQDPTPAEYQDLYVINDVTQQIYYAKGVTYKNKSYFTTDTGVTEVSRVDKYAFEDGFGIESMSTIFQKNKQANERIIATSNVEISIDTSNYVESTLSYVYAEEEQDEDSLKNLSYSKFTINSDNGATLVSKGLDRLTQKYYLILRVLDINGEYHYLQQQVDRLENAESGWVLADDKNEDNDWYQYLDTSGAGTIAKVNAPILADGMEAVKYAGEDTMDASTIETLTSGSRWANAVTKDGSMWVWIPRYAYRITSGYHQSGADINPDNPELGAGTIEIAFVDTQNHFLDKSLRGQTILTSGVTDETYTASNVWILEPAFEFGDEHLTGFWTAKFEASNTRNTMGDDTSLTLQIRPNVASWRNISSLNIFTVCQELKSNSNYERYFNSVANVDTHMTKNIEWGACAYLAHSKYGLKGIEICINTNSSNITGMGSGTQTYINNTNFQYNTSIGMQSSTTQNIYGIYDMSGGANELVASCLEGYTNYLTNNENEKYIDIYSNSYSISNYGDAIYETSRVTGGSTHNASWFKDYSRGIDTTYPFFTRGGIDAYVDTNAGLFCFNRIDGNVNGKVGFRPTIAITDEDSKDQIQNIPEGWAVANSNNTANDWYAYKDTSSVSGTIASVNAPKLADGMTPIKYVGEEDTTSSDLATLTSGSKWANAMTKDGSMWVWIPRYAYKITSGYHQRGSDINTENGTQGAGTIEIAFVDTENHFLDKSLRGQTILTGGVTDETYTASNVWILEPAFEFGDEHLSGLWFAKFEASNTYWYGDDSATADNTALTLQVKPNVTSWRSITSLNMFTVCQELTSNKNYEKYFDNVTNVDTHMTKNVEWGAVAYLAHSKYGLDGEEICINTNNSYLTGMGSNSMQSRINTDDQYNTINAISSSTTSNVYGIYDMSGCANEYVAGCYTGKTSMLTSNSDYTFISKYIDVYSSYGISKFGDSVYETSSSPSNGNAWFSDYLGFIWSQRPIMTRGGYYYGSNGCGLFSFNLGDGAQGSEFSFRPVCIVN